MTTRRHLTTLPKGSSLPDGSTLPDGYPFILTSDGALYQWDVVTEGWVSLSGGVGGASDLADLGDVDLTGLTTNDILKYDGLKWTPAAESGGGGGGATAEVVPLLPYRYVQATTGFGTSYLASALDEGGTGITSNAPGDLPEPWATNAPGAACLKWTAPTSTSIQTFLTLRAPHQVASAITALKARVLYRFSPGTNGHFRIFDCQCASNLAQTSRLDSTTTTAGDFVWSDPFDLTPDAMGLWAVRLELHIGATGGTAPSLEVVSLEVWEDDGVTIELLNKDAQTVLVDHKSNDALGGVDTTVNDGPWQFVYPYGPGVLASYDYGWRSGGRSLTPIMETAFGGGVTAYQYKPTSGTIVPVQPPLTSGTELKRCSDLKCSYGGNYGGLTFDGPIGEYEVWAEVYVTGLVAGDLVTWYEVNPVTNNELTVKHDVVPAGQTEIYTRATVRKFRGQFDTLEPPRAMVTSAQAAYKIAAAYAGARLLSTTDPITEPESRTNSNLVDSFAASGGAGAITFTWTGRANARDGAKQISVIAQKLGTNDQSGSNYLTTAASGSLTGLTAGKWIVFLVSNKPVAPVQGKSVVTVT